MRTSDGKKIGGDIYVTTLFRRNRSKVYSKTTVFEKIQRNKFAGEQSSVELYLRPCQISMIEFFVEILNG